MLTRLARHFSVNSGAWRLGLFLVICAVALFPWNKVLVAQAPKPADKKAADKNAADKNGADKNGADAAADKNAADKSAETADKEGEAKAADAPKEGEVDLNLWELMLAGGWLMVPIVGMSIIVVTFAAERFAGTRRSKVIPEQLVESLGQVVEKRGRFDPREAYRICQQFPCAASNIIRKVLLKIGRPISEIEHTISEASEREAEKLYANVRPINLGVAITPLLGLLGTVQGMIQAFAVTATLPPGANKTEHLAKGIYVALVTTFAGLSVAIPAAMLSHYFEGRIQRLFHDIDDLVQSLIPHLERFEGKMRVRPKKSGESEEPEEFPVESSSVPAEGVASAE